MGALDIRVGDVVRLKPQTVSVVWSDGDVEFVKDSPFFRASDIESIISRAETDAEKIARLEAELAKAPRRIEWGGGECPVGPLTFVTVWVSNGNISTDRANTYRWTHSAEIGWNNIVAYMVLPS